jgi:amidase
VSELLLRPAVELAALIRSGELGARELVQASLDRIEALQPRVNAFTHIAHESALATAATIGPGDPRPFAGVPIAIKDNRAVAGMPITMCSDLFDGVISDADAFCVRRIREAGFVIVGKTTLPEMGIPTTPRAAPAAARRLPWRPVWCRSPTATTAADRSGSPPPAAGS